jgi:type IV pilus assembly protein PilV
VTRAAGFTLLEVLITMIVLAIGMLGLANLQSKIHVTEVESYQRAHAVLLLQDMVDRMSANRTAAASYAGATLGTPNATADCSGIANLAARDRCEWQNALLGASEQASGTNVGAMIGARGCIEQIQAANPNPGVCLPGIYRITVAWQGLYRTAAPEATLTCGLNAYTDTTNTVDETLRRVVTAQVVIGTPTCSPIP